MYRVPEHTAQQSEHRTRYEAKRGYTSNIPSYSKLRVQQQNLLSMDDSQPRCALTPPNPNPSSSMSHPLTPNINSTHTLLPQATAPRVPSYSSVQRLSNIQHPRIPCRQTNLLKKMPMQSSPQNLLYWHKSLLQPRSDC